MPKLPIISGMEAIKALAEIGMMNDWLTAVSLGKEENKPIETIEIKN